MENVLGGFVLPLLLLSASLLNWSLISLVDLLIFLVIQFAYKKIGFRFRRHTLFSWCIIIFSLLTLLSHAIFHIVHLILGEKWNAAGSWWAQLVGFVSVQAWRTLPIYCFLVVQLLVAVAALVDAYSSRFDQIPVRASSWQRFSSSIDHLGSHIRVACCLVLPAIQLVVGISHPSWISLPFFICSCVGLVDWSLTSNFLGLFRWWRPLLMYAGFNIVLLYVYQLPIELPKMLEFVAHLVGLYKVAANTDWPQITSALSLVLFYFMLSSVKSDLEEMDFIMSMRQSSFSEPLLPSRHAFFIRESRTGVRHTNVLLSGAVFRTFSINFFTYGFPVLLVALSFWSFNFTSICAFGLLAYIGYILYAFPSLFHLHRLNGLLLVFILLWAASTYVFNVAFTYLNRLGKDMEIWETVGFWHYPIPGFFLLAQFCLGFLVAMGNLVNNSVFLYLSDEDRTPTVYDTLEEKEETKVLIVATVAWGIRKCSRAISLALILLLALKPGFIHAVYMVFFLMFLLRHTVSRNIRKSLILLCEIHFALLYILRLNIISKALEQKGSLAKEILTQLGLLDLVTHWDYFQIAILLFFCAIHNHGSDLLFSFSSIVHYTPCPPVGFSILKAGLNRSVLLSVYASAAARQGQLHNSSHERRIATYLAAIGQKFLSIYRSFGTYIAFLTILITVYLVTPNFISFGYFFFLLFWIIGRQLVEKTKRRLWYPLKIYAIVVLVFVYILSIFPRFQTWLSEYIDLYHDLGFNPKATLMKNVWESLAIVIVMQLYSYERRQSRYISEDHGPLETGALGFARRLLIWHCDKILYVAIFYASLSPISLFGFLYLLGLLICSLLPKASRVPSKLFLVYTGLLVITEYLYQLWGKQAEMFPGQKHAYLSIFLGFQSFNPGFWGREYGLRGKVLVIVACSLQYNVFRWLEKTPIALINRGKWEEPCQLFVSKADPMARVSVSDEENKPNNISILPSEKGKSISRKNSLPNIGSTSTSSQGLSSLSSEVGASSEKKRNMRFRFMWGSFNESHKWNKKRIYALRSERLEMQITTMKVYSKFWMENMFNLFGLEVNMITLLVASFAVLNAVSMLYIASLAACILLERRVIRKFWPVFVFCFASVLIVEYFVIWTKQTPWIQQFPGEKKINCHECWRLSNQYVDYCRNCWLGVIIDDYRMLVSYYVVIMLACLKLRADHLVSLSGSHTYRQMMSQRKNASVWRDLSFETKGMWTFIDYLRLYCYCHLLDIVLALILITGTLEYDILHLGYLGFALVFFRLRLEILKKKNNIFKFLRIYNFSLIILSLVYQSPFLGGFSDGKCGTMDYIYEMVGFYKYDYGFRITSRSALVEIIIFMLVGLQSYMFASNEFDYVCRYLEAEQIGAIVREQEKKAAWKTEQLQHIRESEEQKRQRNLQVEKMKSEMLNLQLQLHNMNTTTNNGNPTPEVEGVRRRRNSPVPNVDTRTVMSDKENHSAVRMLDSKTNTEIDLLFPHELHGSPEIKSATHSPVGSPIHEITDIPEIMELNEKPAKNAFSDPDRKEKQNRRSKEHPLISAVQLIGDGVSQVQTLGNQAVSNLVTFLNISPEESNMNEQSSPDDDESQKKRFGHLDRAVSLHSDDGDRTMSEAVSRQIGKIFCYIWAQMRSNNDVVCYSCFILVFLWNFSLLSMVYLAALFLYALCVHTGPSYMFWVIMLIYTEVYILLQYLYQIIIQHCGVRITWSFLPELGFPPAPITASFVISTLPLFLVYLFTLLQSSITAKDGELVSLTEFTIFKRRVFHAEEVFVNYSLKERVQKLFSVVTSFIAMITTSISRYWKSLTQGAESPPYFVQVTMDVNMWPEDGIQPERIESRVNKLLTVVHGKRCKEDNPNMCHSASRVRIQSIEKSQESPKVALAVFEVVYASSLEECMPTERYMSLTPAADVAKEMVKAQHSGLVEEMGFPYPINSVIGGGKREVDLYAYVFGTDLAVFFLVAVFYQSVIKNNSQFLDVYQLEDQFPKEFVFILMVIFFLIVLDRIIYLCSFPTGKVVFYICSIILFTYSVTVYAWNMDPLHRRAGGFALRAIYLMKAASLVLQAIQIRYGIPHQSTLYQQFLTSDVSRLNYLWFRVYRVVPFLYELRCVLDWSCTTTSLTMYDWLKLEDIYSSLYLVKCDAKLNRANHQQGQKQTKMTKFCGGICLFFVLICVIWAPMLMYSSGNPTNIANPINEAAVQIDIKTSGGRLTLYQTTLCEKLPWETLNASVVINLDPLDYLASYNVKDIQLICCQSDASSMWLLPPAVQSRFAQSLILDMSIVFSWVFTRDRPKGKEVVKYDSLPKLPPSPSAVQKVLNGTTNSFNMSLVYPRYFRLTGSGDVRVLEQVVWSMDPSSFVNGTVVMNNGSVPWWSFHDTDARDKRSCGGLTGAMAIIVSEETPQGLLGETLSKFSIWSLYITFVLAVGRFIRLQCSDLRMRIPYENLPSCDRLIAICEDIYAARAEGELEVEEVLYWTLVKIYRSPHMLLEYTKLE